LNATAPRIGYAGVPSAGCTDRIRQKTNRQKTGDLVNAGIENGTRL
jgi:hypothetical protein